MRSRAIGPVLGLVAVFFGGLLLRGAVPAVPTGQWLAGAPVTQLRTGAVPVALADGRVALIGGRGADGAATAAVEIIGTDGSIAPGAPMSMPRAGHAAVRLPDGSVLVIGGTTLVAGDTGTVEAATATSEVYFPDANLWTPAASLAAARTGLTATSVADGRVLVAGGTGDTGALDSLEVYDPTATTFHSLGVMSSPRVEQAAAAAGATSVLVVGGRNGDAVLATADLVDLDSGSVVPVTLNAARAGASATALLDGRVFVAGGWDGTTELASAEIVDPATGFSAAVPTAMSSARRDQQAVRLEHNATVLLVGGTAGGAVVPTVEQFVPWTGEFRASNPEQTPRSGVAVAHTAMNGVLVAAGGKAADGSLAAQSELYGFATLKTDKDDYAPGEFVTITGSGWQPGETVHLVLKETGPTPDPDVPLDAVADANGNIVNDAWAPDEHDIGMRFYLTATGAASAAQLTFSDSTKIKQNGITVVGSQTPNPVVPGNSATYGTVASNSVQVGFNGNGGCTVTLSVSAGLPTGAAAVFAPASLTAGSTVTLNSLLTISTTSTTPVGSFTLTVKAQGTGGTGNDCATTDSETTTTTLVVQAASDTTAPTTSIALSPASPNGTNGWYTSNVHVTVSATDNAGGSGVAETRCVIDPGVAPANFDALPASCSFLGGGADVTADGTHVVYAASRDTANNKESPVKSASFKIDQTAPTITFQSQLPAANGNGWNNTDVTLTWTCSDSLGVVSATVSQTVTTNGANQSATGTCQDNAGNTASDTQSGINIDKVAPTITFQGQSPAANGAGWNNTDVTLSWTCTDALSGPATSPVTQTISSEGTHQSATGTCDDLAGNSASHTDGDINIDKSAPNAPTGHESPGANANGWHNSSPVGVSFTDNGDVGPSGIAFCTSSSNVTGDTSGTDVVGTCTDKAGNVSPQTTVTVRIDLTKPVITGSRLPAANANGWNNTNVTVSFVCADSGGVQSGIGTDTVAGATLSSDGANQSVTNTGTCEDLAGNAADAATVSGINIDKSAPNAPTGQQTPGANANGWHNTSPVAVSFTATTDNGPSGIDFCTTESNVSGETAGTDVVGTCTDKAGNVSPQTTVTVKIDLTKPVITGSRTPAPNANGWNNVNVTVSFVCADSGGVQSGIGTDTVAGATLSSEGANQSVTNTGVCEDLAGNAADASTVSGINIDKSAPTIDGSRLPLANGYGWNNVDVTVTFTCSDGLSGLAAGSPPAPTTLTTEGASQSVPGSCTDKAGNTASTTVSGINIDKTNPTVTITTPPNGASYVLNQGVASAYVCNDGLSTIATCVGPVANGSNIDTSIGSHSFAVTATDKAGNTATATNTYSVQFAFAGFFAPVDNLPVINKANAGQAIPVKWRLTDANGVGVADSSSFVSLTVYPVTCGAWSALPSDPLPDQTASTSGLLYQGGGNWQFNWKTPKNYAGSCLVVRLTLNDSTTHDFAVSFK